MCVHSARCSGCGVHALLHLRRPVTEVELVGQNCEEEEEEEEKEEEGEDDEYEVEVVAPATPEPVMQPIQPIDGQAEVMVPLPG